MFGDLLYALLFLAFVLMIITLIGHGIWVLLAAIFGSGRKQPKQPCPFCGNPNRSGQLYCDRCYKDLTAPLARELFDLAVVRRQLERFREKSSLPSKSVDEMLAQLDAYRWGLLKPGDRKHADLAARPAPVVREPVVAVSIDQPAVASEPLLAEPVAAESSPAEPSPAEVLPVEPITADAPAAEMLKAEPVKEELQREPPAELLRPVSSEGKDQAGRPGAHAESHVGKPNLRRQPSVRTWTEVLAAFMEQQNIRWGELIGGLLFVCSSVALVVSLWETLERIPYFKFFIFVSVSSAVFGVGLYAHYRWKLESTSRALLVIATLLVPLNFVAMASMAKGEWTVLALGNELVSLAIFAGLAGLAARILVPEARWLMVAAVLGDSIAVLWIARWVRPESTAWLMNAAGAIPVALFAGSVGRGAWSVGWKTGDVECLTPHASRPTRLDSLTGLVTLLGITAFATAVALGLLVARAILPLAGSPAILSGYVAMVLQRLSVLFAAAAVPVLAGGLTVLRGSGRKKELAAWRLAGTVVALVGMLAMLAALGLAWPSPGWVVAVAALNAVSMIFAAFRWRLPVLHGGAIASAALAYLTVFYLLTGQLAVNNGGPYGSEMLRLLISARSGTALAGLFLALAGVSEFLARRGWRRHSVIYFGGCWVVAAIGLLLVTVHGARTGGPDALRAAILYAVYGTGCLALVARWRRLDLSYLGMTLVAAAALWGMWWEWQHVGPIWGAVLGIESLGMAVLAAVIGRYGKGEWYEPALLFVDDLRASAMPRSKGLGLADLYRIPAMHVAEAAAILAAGLAAWAAWFDRALIVASPTPAPIVASGAIAAVYFILAWVYRSPERTWVASLVALAGLIHTLNFNYFPGIGYIGPNWTIALLTHATLAVLAAVCLDRSRWAVRELRRCIGDPLADSALFSSTVVLLPLVFGRSAGSLWLACCFPWLAAVWLVQAMRKRSAGLFAGHQAALAFAALAAATAWMRYAHLIAPAAIVTKTPNLLERIASYSHIFLEPLVLQVYGIALGLYSLVWAVARIIDLRRATKTQSAPSLLQAEVSVDWCIRHAVVAVELLVAAAAALAEVPRELLPGGAAPEAVPAAFGPTAWVLLAVLALVLVTTLWERWRTTELVAMLLVVAAAAYLVSGRFATHLAVASALRWSLAGGFLLASIAVWGRATFADACHRLQAGPFAPGSPVLPEIAPKIARGVLLATLALPMLTITVIAAGLDIGGLPSAGPLGGTFFERLGPSLSYLVPLGLVIAALVGYALRERSSGYAFSAGMVLELAVMLGYALKTSLSGRPFDAAYTVTLWDLVGVTAAGWAIVWLAARKWVDVWRESPAVLATATASRSLMNVQIGLAILAQVVVLSIAVFGVAQLPVRWSPWSVAAGLPLGWIALGLLLAAGLVRGRFHPHAVGLSGMAAIGLLASTVHGLQPAWNWHLEPIWGYRALMLGWALYALLVVAAVWWISSRRTAVQAAVPENAVGVAAVWVRVAGIAAVLLGIRAALWLQNEQLWAAAAIASASVSMAVMAVWLHREGWAFAAALGVNLAASLVVRHFELLGGVGIELSTLRLVQANLIASAVVALVWLAARKRLYTAGELTLAESPLLATQVFLPMVGNYVLAALPVGWLIQTPGWLPARMHELAATQGWIALLATAAAAAWYLRQTKLGSWLHVLGCLVVGLAVLTACGIDSYDRLHAAGSWVAYHALTTAWASAGLVFLAVATGFSYARGSSPEQSEHCSLVEKWVSAICALTLALATLHAFHDPARPWWAAGAILAVSLAAGLVAMLLRRPSQVFLSGFLVNLAGTIVWWAWSPASANWPAWGLAEIASLAEANVLCLAIASIAWSLLEFLPRGVPQAGDEGQESFTHLAAQLGAAVVALVTVAGIFNTLCALPRLPIERLDWIALAASATATAICLRDRRAEFPMPALYGLGLAGVGMGLLSRQFGPRMFCWSAGDALAGYALAAAMLAWLFLRTPGSNVESRGRDFFAGPVFSRLQAATIATAGGLTFWAAVAFRFDACRFEYLPWWLAGRQAAVAGLLILLVSAVVMATAGGNEWRARWQRAAFTLGLLLLCGFGCALLPADCPVPWLHRGTALLAAAAALGLWAAFGLRRVVPGDSDWLDRAREATPLVAGLAIAALVSVLGQETSLFELPDGAPLLPAAIATTIVAVAALMAGCFAFAVSPECDPLGLSDRGRQGYVYAAEALLAAVGAHVWLTMPWLFKGYLIDYWMLIVMTVAFVGAGLSEWFQRRGQAVLSEPFARTAVLLPLLPAVGFWLAPMVEGPWRLVGRAPVVWWMMAAFYALLSFTRRSWKYMALAVLTANVGLWVALDLSGFEFFRNPQIFVIPLALAGLVAEYLNHDQLSEAQSAAVRYLALSAIYVSSTADMFIAGLGHSWLLPLVLMVLSVAGMLAGISFRVRSFLFLGLTFLVLDALSMIWYAAHDLHHTWIWYVCGIALGAAILALFALFEKRRNEVLAAVEELKEWAK